MLSIRRSKKVVNLLMFTILTVAVFSVSAQQKATKPPPASRTSKPGLVSGRIFAITQAGDIKPARMARVYLFYSARSLAAWSNEKATDSADMAWMNERLKASNEDTQEFMRDGSNWDDSLICRKELSTYDKALLGVLKWGEDPKNKNDIFLVSVDEEGVFKTEVARPGVYTVVGRGRAGFNDAVWIQNQVVVEPGKETVIKLSSPEKACLVMQ